MFKEQKTMEKKYINSTQESEFSSEKDQLFFQIKNVFVMKE